MGSVFDTVLRPAIVAASRSERIKDSSQRWPVTGRVVRRFVPGESLDAAMAAVGAELADGLSVSVDFLGEDTLDESQADTTVTAYLALLESLSGRRPAPAGSLEVSLKLTALGLALPEHGAKIAEENARTITAAARRGEAYGAWSSVAGAGHGGSTVHLPGATRPAPEWIPGADVHSLTPGLTTPSYCLCPHAVASGPC